MDNQTTGVIEHWNAFSNGRGDSFVVGYVVQRGQIVKATTKLRLIEPVTYMDRVSKLCQSDGRLYELGSESNRSKTTMKRLAAQIRGT